MFNVKSSEVGAVAWCPYCLAGMHPRPAIGSSIVFLNESDVGQSGLVMADQWRTCPSDRFLAKMAHEETGTLRMAMPSHELFLDVELLVVPAWMPPVSSKTMPSCMIAFCILWTSYR